MSINLSCRQLFEASQLFNHTDELRLYQNKNIFITNGEVTYQLLFDLGYSYWERVLCPTIIPSLFTTEIESLFGLVPTSKP